MSSEADRSYDQLLPYCNEALVTEIRRVFDADTRITLPRDLPDWDKAAESDTIEENGVSYGIYGLQETSVMSEKEKRNVPAAVILAEAIRTETVRVRISRAAEERMEIDRRCRAENETAALRPKKIRPRAGGVF